MSSDDALYLDHNATTPCDERVVQAMLPYFTESFWNPSSGHALGRRALRAVEEARERTASALATHPDRVIFTSGATESISIALERLPRPMLESYGMACSPVEHRAVRNSISRIKNLGVPARTLNTGEGGIVDLNSVDRPSVYVVQAANSETGILQPIGGIAQRVREVGGILVCDAAQALWKMPLGTILESCDAVVLSAHKAYGPKGIGALVVSEDFRRLLRLSGAQAQEQGVREGTINVPAVVGFAAIAEIVAAESHAWQANARAARDDLERRLCDQAEGAIEPQFTAFERLPNTASLRFVGLPGDLVISNLKHVALSYGSACSSGTPEPSGVLLASGLDYNAAGQTLRASFGRDGNPDAARRAFEDLLLTTRELTQAI